MAYNIRPLEFNPSQAVMQGAGAFSRLGDSMLQRSYQDDRAKAQDNQFKLGHQLLQDKFGYQKQRDVTTDGQWEQAFNETKGNNAFNQGMKVADYTAGREDASNTNAYRNKAYGLQALEYDMKKKAYDDSQSGLGFFSEWYTKEHPEMQNIQGRTPQGVAKVAEFEAKKTPSEYQTILGNIKNQELESKKQQQRDYRAKNFGDVIAGTPMYNKLNDNQKAQYYNHFVETGQLPPISKTEGENFWNSDSYSFTAGKSNQSKYDPAGDVQELTELMKQLNQGK